MGNSNKSTLRKTQSVPDTQKLALDAPVFDKQKSVSQLRLNQPHEKPGKPAKAGKKQKQHNSEEIPQLALSDSAFLPEFPLRGELEDLDFHVLGVIARGAYGNVIKVQREDNKQFYAAKVLDKAQIIEEGAIRQCKDEATIQSMAGEHFFVVKAHEYWQSSGNLYIVLDYVPHGDMFTLWTFHGAFPEQLVRVYIAEMAMVIDFLHNASVIYRDVKMENILFNAKGHIQLTDFGLAKWLQGGDQTRTVCGTLQYMAPEVLSVYPYGHSADWWSLGILMYAMLAGRYPVDGADTHTKMAQRVFECDFLLPSDISDLAQDVINNLLTKSPHKRMCDVNSLQDLEFFQDMFFADLIGQKINPLDVVPEDFFPMTGHSWAPQLLTPGEQSDFDQFDGNNDNFTDDYGNPRPGQYRQSGPKHHPDPVVRLQPSQPHHLHHQPPHMNGRHHSSPSEQTLNQHPGDEKQFVHQHPPGDKQYGHQHPPGDKQFVHQHPPGDKQYGHQQRLGDKQYNHQPPPGEKQYSHQHHQHPQDHKKPFADFPRPVPSASGHNSGQAEVNVRSDAGTSDRRREFISNLSTKTVANQGNKPDDLQPARHNSLDNLLLQNNADAGGDNNFSRINGSSERITRSNSSSDRKGSGSNSDASRRISNELRLAYSSTALNSVNPPAENTNRISAEYKTVEAPPTVTLKTMMPASSMLPKNNENYASYGSPANVGSCRLSGSAPQNFGVEAQSFGFSASSHKSDYSVQGQSSRIHPHSEGTRVSGDSRVVDRGYKTFEVAPTMTLPSPQISFSPNPSLPQSNNLQPSLPQSYILQPSLPQSNNLQPSLPQSNILQPSLPQSNILQPSVPQSYIIQPSLPQSYNPQSSLPQSNILQPQSNILQPQSNILEPQSNNLQPSLAQSNNLQPSMILNNLQRSQPTSNHFTFPSSTPASSPFTSTNYGRLEQAAATLNNAPQMNVAAQRPAVPAKPVPAQRPAVPTKPSVPVKPIPAPRRSLRLKSHSRAGHVPQAPGRPAAHPDQNSSLASANYPYTFSASQGPHMTSQNRSVAIDPSLNPQDWRQTPPPQNQAVMENPSFDSPNWGSTPPPPQNRTAMNDASFDLQDWRNTAQPPVDENRSRSGSTSYSRREPASASPSVDSENFEWKLPMGTRPSFV